MSRPPHTDEETNAQFAERMRLKREGPRAAPVEYAVGVPGMLGGPSDKPLLGEQPAADKRLGGVPLKRKRLAKPKPILGSTIFGSALAMPDPTAGYLAADANPTRAK